MEPTTYILFNLKSNKPLMHPTVGLWFTNDKKEAEELLSEFHIYVKDIGHEELISDLVVREMKDVSYI
jgi:hypothetical protein